MNIKKLTFKAIRLLSSFASVGVLASGFFFPMSIQQGFVYNPLLLLGLLSLFGYANSRLDKLNSTAEIHQLKSESKCYLSTMSRAA